MTEYELNQLINPKKDMIKTKSKHRLSLETLIQGRKNELNSTFKKATIRLTFTLIEPSKERISIAGDLSPLGGSADADGLSKVETMCVDGVDVDMETAVTKENIIDAYGMHIDGYFYNFEESGQHTIEYVLSDISVNEGICCTIGNFTYQGLPFTSKISNASVEINANEIEGFSFGYSPAIESVTIGSGVTSIGKYAFYNCSGLINVTIPNTVTNIGEQAFHGCTSLTNVTISNNITSIKSGVFGGCSSLASITIPDSVTSIGLNAFGNCSSLINIIIPDNVLSIGTNAFGSCTSLTIITIPDSVTSIGELAFTGCSSLTSVTIKAITPCALGRQAFNNTNDCPIYVPSTSVDTYKETSGWNRYADRIQPIPTE